MPQGRLPLRVGELSHASWPRGLLYTFLPLHVIPPPLTRQGRQRQMIRPHDGSTVSGNDAAVVSTTMDNSSGLAETVREERL